MWVLTLCGLVGCASIERFTEEGVSSFPFLDRAAPSPSPTLLCLSQRPFEEAIAKANQAVQITQKASRLEDWNLGVLYWMQAIERMQSIPPDHPKWTFAQKKVREYQQNLKVVQQQASTLHPDPIFPTFNSDFVDEQLRLFLSYQAALNTPDVLIVGSSRAIQGVDPRHLQVGLARQGKPNIRVFNFGINGATAQVVDWLVRELLTDQQLPKLIIWADGVRAFNSGRVDRTYEAIANSPGSQRLSQGTRPSLPTPEVPSYNNCIPLQSRPLLPWPQLWGFNPHPAWADLVRNIDANGFLPESRRFDPALYYQQFPRVAGLYDGDYQNFNLTGVQTTALQRLVQYTQEHNISLVFVNLPLSQDYLDSTRQGFENQFQAFMQQQASRQGFIFIDLSRQWLNQNGYFADPSHLNLYGAAAIATQLIDQSPIPWQRLTEASPPPPPSPQPSPEVEATPSPTPEAEATPSPSPSPQMSPTPRPQATLPFPPD
ncbi:hypothetical protein K4A83_15950 [Spirulina subsalsa FACHB-351]|uniref:DUF1574 domain-containing protein n=1 Tax=Spirulina subsalsa FACHB-351 TaxID=234711 RepID=A0ABT3L8C0_9CYAN|nr:hypothetical protein [Spirulina subsalsa FACHB-351]